MMRRVSWIFGSAALVVVALGALLFPTAGTASAEPLAPDVKPDAVLSSGQQFVKVSSDVNVSDPLFLHSPVECREPPFDGTCDVYRIKLNRDPSPEALNFVLFSLEFEPQGETPPLSAAVLGLSSIPVGDLDVYVYDKEDHRLGQDYPGGGNIPFVLETLKTTPAKPIAEILEPELISESDPNDFPPGGATLNVPERGGFTAKQDLYDIVVSAQQGSNAGYTLRIGFSNEKFTTPFEVLDPENVAPPGFFSEIGDPTTPPSESPSQSFDSGTSAIPSLADANVLPDSDLAGIGLGISERFEAPPAVAFRGARNVSNAAAPSGFALIVALVVAPVGAAAAGTFVLRRRRQALI